MLTVLHPICRNKAQVSTPHVVFIPTKQIIDPLYKVNLLHLRGVIANKQHSISK